MIPIQRDDVLELTVEGLADGPDAIARVGGYVVLLPGALPGEVVRARVTKASRKFGRAEVLEVLRPAAERAAPACRHFLHCGGCHWQHMDYRAQLEQKRARLQKALQHHCGETAPPVLDALAGTAPLGQRHKVALQFAPGAEPGAGPVAGLHALRSVELVELAECPASAPRAFALAQRAVEALRRQRLPAFDAVSGRGLLRAVLVRQAHGTEEAQVLIVVARDPVPGIDRVADELLRAGATTVAVNVNDGPPSRLLGRRTYGIAGARRMLERIAGETYCVSADAFFQTSPAAAGALVRIVTHWLQPVRSDTVFDLYCGGGLFALPLARLAGTVVGIEESPIAVGDGAAAATLAGLENVRFLRGPVEDLLLDARGNRLPRPDLAVLDPPREGAAPGALRTLCELEPRRIAYVSCDPDTLARDLAELHRHGYRTRAVVPVDMFPQTSHVEAVAVLQHRRTGKGPARTRARAEEGFADVLPDGLRG